MEMFCRTCWAVLMVMLFLCIVVGMPLAITPDPWNRIAKWMIIVTIAFALFNMLLMVWNYDEEWSYDMWGRKY